MDVVPESIAELVDDCAQLPDIVRYPAATAAFEAAGYPSWGRPQQWLIDDSCVAQVVGIDDYGSRARSDVS